MRPATRRFLDDLYRSRYKWESYTTGNYRLLNEVVHELIGEIITRAERRAAKNVVPLSSLWESHDAYLKRIKEGG